MRMKHIRKRNVNSILLYDGKLMGHVLNNHEKKKLNVLIGMLLSLPYAIVR